MSIEKLRPSFTFTEDRLRELQQVVPEAFADGKINWDTLREALGDHLEDEEQEHFGLTWPGKREARRLAAMPSKGTLVPVPGEGVNEENTHNIFIEGDNLEVLKLLQKSYAGRVKMIYIDPPYNTGNDYVYPDDYSEPLETYLKRINSADDEGKILTTNTKASGRFHSNWLNFMYPRLLLAKKLLQNDGVIFVSIDDTEVHNLRLIMEEVFGEENFVADIIWQKKFARQNDATYFSTMHDHILCFAKISINVDIEKGWKLNLLPRTDETNAGYANIDNDPRGPWTSVVLSAKSGTEKLRYKIKTPGGRECMPPEGRYWSVTQDKFNDLVNDNRIWFGSNGNGIPRLKTFLSEVQSGLRPNTIWFHEEVSHNQAARQYLKKLFNGKAVFDSPKPVELLLQMITLASSKRDDIYLDFFAGSGTLAEAVFEKNLSDNGKRKFILVQLPEPINDEKYANIAEICKDRIRRVISKLKTKPFEDIDLGFTAYKLEQSNYQNWQSFEQKDTNQLEMQFSKVESPLVFGWSKINLFTEILILQGFPLDSLIKALPAFHENTIQEVTHEFCAHKLYICLDEKITDTTVEALSIRPEDIFVCLDTALTDEAKLRLSDRCQLKVI